MCSDGVRDGRAVTEASAAEFAARLLVLPQALVSEAAFDQQAARDALHLSGHPLHHRLAEATGRPLPQARARMVAALG